MEENVPKFCSVEETDDDGVAVENECVNTVSRFT